MFKKKKKRDCICNKFQGDVDAAGPRTFCEPISYNKDVGVPVEHNGINIFTYLHKRLLYICIYLNSFPLKKKKVLRAVKQIRGNWPRRPQKAKS